MSALLLLKNIHGVFLRGPFPTLLYLGGLMQRHLLLLGYLVTLEFNEWSIKFQLLTGFLRLTYFSKLGFWPVLNSIELTEHLVCLVRLVVQMGLEV